MRWNKQNIRPRLIALGDSHALYNFAGVAEAKIFWLGPVTMHRAARDGIRVLIPKNCRPKKGDFFVLSFGEIDCRVHVKKQAVLKKTNTIEEVDNLCARFEAALTEFKVTCRANICLMSIGPFNPEFLDCSAYDSPEECRQDAKAIRDRINQRLSKMGGPFIDYRDAFSNADGSIKSDMSDGNVHIDHRISDPILTALGLATGVAYTSRIPPWPYPRSLNEPPYVPPLKQLQKRLLYFTRPFRRKFERFFSDRKTGQKHP
ncbi:hypothetical protein HCG46_26155 [Labrenzia sp. PO1]|uniref:SGNH/GDSL hydrolase family protein n=1 Tax=Labrenzia sp. PO1 TaxID=2720390 RepID=UPI0014475FD6|nr:SGNH/GDSL hydrolase family protein [Labrenzia sp. PO1]NKI61785.1 hypothetical protein [Labrenzia sp. PO1]